MEALFEGAAGLFQMPQMTPAKLLNMTPLWVRFRACAHARTHTRTHAAPCGAHTLVANVHARTPTNTDVCAHA